MRAYNTQLEGFRYQRHEIMAALKRSNGRGVDIVRRRLELRPRWESLASFFDISVYKAKTEFVKTVAEACQYLDAMNGKKKNPSPYVEGNKWREKKYGGRIDDGILAR